MKQITKRAISVTLMAVMLVGIMALFSCNGSDDSKNDNTNDSSEISAIEEQIRAFAKSIDKSNANSSAAIALAKHGIVGNGKNLSVGKDHALTATLMNAELSLTTIVQGCTVAIEKIQKLNLSSIFGDAGCYFGTNNAHYYVAALYREGNDNGVGTDVLQISKLIDYNKPFNTYDSSLVWMAGSTEIHIYITQANITANEITYNVKVVFDDDFDFNTNEGSVPREIASFIGSALFRNFRWTATAEFHLILPNNLNQIATAD